MPIKGVVDTLMFVSKKMFKNNGFFSKQDIRNFKGDIENNFLKNPCFNWVLIRRCTV